MEKKIFLLLPMIILLASLFLGGYAHARIDPIVSTDWLLANINNDNLVMIDIRDPGSYAAGHIPGAINEPFVTAFDPCTGPTSNWIVGSSDCLWLQVPNPDDLFVTIGNLGITSNSWVVIVTAPNPDEPPYYGFANATRVAATLIYAGVENVAILDGGYPKWMAEPEKPISTEAPIVTPVTYEGRVNGGVFAPIGYVQSRLNLNIVDIIDARDADVYFGAAIEPFAPVPGHIPGASSLPAPFIWEFNSENGTYTYKDSETLGAMAAGVIRDPLRYRGFWGLWWQQIIVYCGVGGYGSAWWFVLTQVLGYPNVRLYDGSAQEWVMEGNEMVPYQWE